MLVAFLWTCWNSHELDEVKSQELSNWTQCRFSHTHKCLHNLTLWCLFLWFHNKKNTRFVYLIANYIYMVIATIFKDASNVTDSIFDFDSFSFSRLAKTVLSIIWNYLFCEDLKIFMESIECDRASGLIASSVNLNAYKHLQNSIICIDFLMISCKISLGECFTPSHASHGCCKLILSRFLVYF